MGKDGGHIRNSPELRKLTSRLVAEKRLWRPLVQQQPDVKLGGKDGWRTNFIVVWVVRIGGCWIRRK